MRIIKETFLSEAAKEYPDAASFLTEWRKVAKQAEWQNLEDVRKQYPKTDMVRVKSGKQASVFNVCGNKYRLIVAIHFNTKIVYTMRFLTHADYSKDKWKAQL